MHALFESTRVGRSNEVLSVFRGPRGIARVCLVPIDGVKQQHPTRAHTQVRTDDAAYKIFL